MRPAPAPALSSALVALAEEELALLLDGRFAEDTSALAAVAERRDALMAQLRAAGPLTEDDRVCLRRAAELQAAVTRALADARAAVSAELRGAADGRRAAAAYAQA